MRWPWSKPEKRASVYTDAIVQYLETQAASTTAHATSTAAAEQAAGALSRALGAAEVEAAPLIQRMVSPAFLTQCGRDLILRGQSLHVIAMDADSAMLLPASDYTWEGGHDPRTWIVRATVSGPTSQATYRLPAAGTIFVKWGSTNSQPHIGVSALGFASTSAKLAAETERSLADELAGPLAQLLAIPQDGGDNGNDDPLAALKQDIGRARGKALLVESTQQGWGEGRVAAPQRDWSSSRLGPALQIPESLHSTASGVGNDSRGRIRFDPGCLWSASSFGSCEC